VILEVEQYAVKLIMGMVFGERARRHSRTHNPHPPPTVSLPR